ncbi:macro domain-containing protein [Aeribacillus pallidus]|uniref:macro domain-containing protein n=1 Tax=Aeribacillus composti TaxID=1868734 RepID=UPI002E243B48|nr:macro domain-containing protein [Aeribacillus composti]MED4487223.1 macro domain-containing protein [Aeribacillus pallidus]
MIKHVHGNAINVKAELLVNASNGKGWMGGLIGRFIPLKGVAESIHYADPSIERLAKRESKRLNVKCGDVFHTNAGKLNFPKGILHAVTMNKPGQTSDLGTIKKCILNISKYCEENSINSVSLPILGTGTGRVPIEDVLKLYHKMLQTHKTLFYIVHFKR